MGLLDDEYRGAKQQASPGLLDQIGGYLGAGLSRANDWVRTGLAINPADLQRLGTDMAANAVSQNAAVGAGNVAVHKRLSGQEPTPEEWEAMHNSPVGGFGTDAGGGGGAFAAMFAGAKSATANRALLQQAKNAIAGGADPEAVRQATGWVRGLDGEWKYEISDHLADFKVDPKTGKVKLHHPELRRAYPDLVDNLDVRFFHGNPGDQARYYPQDGRIELNAALPPAAQKSALLHELQHPIQEIEGFSPGASPQHVGILALERAERDLLRKQYTATVNEFNEKFEKFKADRMAADPKRYKRLGDKHIREIFENQPDTADLFRRYDHARNGLGWIDTPDGIKFRAHQAYERAMGEAEAREVQLRMDMTPDQRKADAPYKHGRAVVPRRLIDMRLLQPEDPQPLSGLLSQVLGPSPEAKGTLASLLGVGLFSKDAE